MNRRTVILATLALPLVAAGCGRIRESRINPLNWFGGARRRKAASVTTAAERSDGRILVREVMGMEVEPTQGGAIVRATGLPPSQGWWNAELVSETRGRADAEGVLTYRFLVYPPLTPAPAVTPGSRQLTAATFVTANRLEAVRTIVVQGETNSLSSGR